MSVETPQETEAFPIREKLIENKNLDVDTCQQIREAVYRSIRVRRELAEYRGSLVGTPEESSRLSGVCLWVLSEWDYAVDILAQHAADPVGGYLYADSLLAMGRAAEAVPVLEPLAKKNKGCALTGMELARAYRESGDYEKALEILEANAKDWSTRDRFHYEWGMTQDAGGEYGAAKGGYEKALEINPQCTQALFRLGYNEALRGETIAAIEYFERTASIDPVHEETMLNLGSLYEDEEDWERAITCYNRILDENPNHERAFLFRKDALASMTMYFDEDMARRADRHNQALQIPITDFELSVRSRNCLQKMNIRTLGDLVQKSEQELLSYKNFGETSLMEIKNLLAKRGLRLGMSRMSSEPSGGVGRITPSDDILERPVDDLEFSIRCRNCLAALGIRTVGDLVSKREEDLMDVRNFGQTSLREIKSKLQDLNLSLGS